MATSWEESSSDGGGSDSDVEKDGNDKNHSTSENTKSATETAPVAKAPKRPKSLLKHREDMQRKEQRRKQKKLQKVKRREKEQKKLQNKKEQQQKWKEQEEAQRQEREQVQELPQSKKGQVNLLVARKKTTKKAPPQPQLAVAERTKKKQNASPAHSSSSEEDGSMDSDDGTNIRANNISALAEEPKPRMISALANPNIPKRKRRSRASLDNPSARGNSHGDGSEQEAVSDEEEITKTKRKRQKSTTESNRKPKTSKTKAKNQQKWTEVLAPGHILADEVGDYIKEHKDDLTTSEVAYLRQWVANVQSELQEQNQLLVENIMLVTDLRRTNTQSNQMQTQILQQKRKLQALKQETAMYQAQATNAEEDQSRTDSANRFLQSLRDMTKKNTE